jgi:hypothetical protein
MIGQTAPVLKHMDIVAVVHHPQKKSRRERNAAVSDDEEEILDLDQVLLLLCFDDSEVHEFFLWFWRS